MRVTQKVNAVVMRNIGHILCEENFQNAKQKISFLSKYLFENEIMTNLFQPNVPLLYPLKTSENLIGFLTFSGVQQRKIGLKLTYHDVLKKHSIGK